MRLVGGDHNTRGRLEVHHNGTWGTVCGDFFNEAAARVVCNLLGFGYAHTVSHRDKKDGLCWVGSATLSRPGGRTLL